MGTYIYTWPPYGIELSVDEVPVVACANGEFLNLLFFVEDEICVASVAARLVTHPGYAGTKMTRNCEVASLAFLCRRSQTGYESMWRLH